MVNKHSLTTEQEKSPVWALLKQHNFRTLWLSESLSLLGDQFYLIALPWLVLQLTGNAFVMGTVLAVAGIPRALFMLVGGALTDRFSPRKIILTSIVLRMVLVALMAFLVLSAIIKLWMIYLCALLFGLVDAFFFPASAAIVPKLVEDRQLQTGNALIHGTAQLSLFAGPVFAGLLIALLDRGQATMVVGEAVPDVWGIGIALGVAALIFLVSGAVFTRMSFLQKAPKPKSSRRSVWASIREGLISVWRDDALRNLMLIIAAVNLLFNGPILVGIPVLADTRFPEGAAAFGVLMSAYGAGSLLGTLSAGILPRPDKRYMGQILLGVISTLGIGLMLLTVVDSTLPAALISMEMGAAYGYVGILIVTWLQTRTPPMMLGRMMSLLMFASIGLAPISMALSGAVLKINMNALFMGAGMLLIAVVIWSAFNSTVRTIGTSPINI